MKFAEKISAINEWMFNEIMDVLCPNIEEFGWLCIEQEAAPPREIAQRYITIVKEFIEKENILISEYTYAVGD